LQAARPVTDRTAHEAGKIPVMTARSEFE